ncbi:MAG: hypothetical protein IJP78_02045 [Clostridia bacterium]|nr:hypothetical protein [Clostridia bacterium]
MPSQRKSARKQSVTVAFCGMAAALSAVIMLIGGVIPAATYAVPMLCGALLLPILIELGKTAAWATFFSVAFLALILGFDKEAAFFYLFIGYYPIVKWPLDKIRPKWKRILCKGLLFTCAIGLMYGLLYLLFPMEAMIQEFRDMGVFLSVGFVIAYVGCMFLYDRLLVRLLPLYANRIRPKLKFLTRQ